MPINPEIPLQFKPPEIDNPTHIFSQALSLQHLAQQGPLIAQRIEAEKLENQKRQEELNDSDILKRSYMEAGDDSQKFLNLARSRGASPKALTSIQEHQALTQDRLLKLKDDERKRVQEQAKAIGSSAQAVLSMPEADRPGAYASQRQELIKRGYIQPEEAPEAYPGDDALTLHRNASLDTEKQIDNIHKAAAEKRAVEADKRAAETHDVDIEGKRADTEAKVRKNLATKLADAADSGDREEYSQAYYSASKDERAPFPHPDKFDEDTAARARNLGMSPSEQSAAGHRNSLEEIAQQNLELRKRRANKESEQTKNSQALDRRKAQNEYDKAVHDEGYLHGLRRSLGSAIASGETYVNPKGVTKPMSVASGGNEKTKQALIEEMQGTLATATEEVQNTITGKYDAGARLGKSPSVSLEKALGAVTGGGNKKPQGPPVELAGPAPAAEAPAKFKYTEAQVREQAAAAGLNPEFAVKAARERKLIP